MANNLAVSSYTIGGDYNTWGTKFVADMAILNKFAGDTKVVSDTSGTVVLTSTDTQNFSIQANGGGASQVDIRVPDTLARYWFVRNDRPSGVITVRCAAGGTSVTLAAGDRQMVYSDGTNCVSLTLGARASYAQFLANSVDLLLETDVVWAAAANEVVLTDAATIAVDMSTFLNAKVTLGGNRTLGQPTNTKNGQSGVIRIIQDGTGSRTLGYHADWKFAFGSKPVLSTTAGATDLLFYQVIAPNVIYASLVKAIA